jgi:hypothetical protein
VRSPKSLLAVGLAACTITPCMINAVGNVAATLKVGPAPVFSLAAMVLAMVSFVVSWNQRSLIASGLLSASGIIFMIPALSAMGHSLAVVVFPGPILGVIFGSVMIGLGVAMGIRKAKTVTVLPR